MAYNKKAHLQANIEAIGLAFALEGTPQPATAEQQAVLQAYSGFGGLKCILNPCDKDEDIALWTKSEAELFPLVQQLHRVIRENARDEKEYKRFYYSLKSSILTAFYTPPSIIQAITDSLQKQGIMPKRLLEPSAVTGAFLQPFKDSLKKNIESHVFEKDYLSGKILSALYPESDVHIKGFEEIDPYYLM